MSRENQLQSSLSFHDAHNIKWRPLQRPPRSVLISDKEGIDMYRAPGGPAQVLENSDRRKQREDCYSICVTSLPLTFHEKMPNKASYRNTSENQPVGGSHWSVCRSRDQPAVHQSTGSEFLFFFFFWAHHTSPLFRQLFYACLFHVDLRAKAAKTWPGAAFSSAMHVNDELGQKELLNVSCQERPKHGQDRVMDTYYIQCSAINCCLPWRHIKANSLWLPPPGYFLLKTPARSRRSGETP